MPKCIVLKLMLGINAKIGINEPFFGQSERPYSITQQCSTQCLMYDLTKIVQAWL